MSQSGAHRAHGDHGYSEQDQRGARTPRASLPPQSSTSNTDDDYEDYRRYHRQRHLPLWQDRDNHGLPFAASSGPFQDDAPEIIYHLSACRWPPPGLTLASELYPQDAEDLIRSGATIYRGYCDEAPYSPPGTYRFYTMLGSEYAKATDRAKFQNKAFKDMSLSLTGSTDTRLPWLSLEQPNMAFSFGAGPGTVTLNFWAGKSGSSLPIVYVDTKVKPRKIGLLGILERLRYLEGGLEEDHPNRLYHNLYEYLIHDPEKNTSPHHAMQEQISDLITVLSRSDWTDFSLPEHQVVADFFSSETPSIKTAFFHQLVLSVELYLRIHSRDHTERAKQKLLPQLPPKIAWDLAVAQRWLENMSLDKPKTERDRTVVSFTLLSKKRQIEALRDFAWLLKWPNMAEVEYIFDEVDSKEKNLEDRSPSSMSWFTGVILPGTSMSWIIMNALISSDRDTGDHLRHLQHRHPNTGFQYRTNTYWSWQCIVGKVLGAAKGVTQAAGWVGPCHFSSDLKRIEVVRIKQPSSIPKLSSKEISTMAQRSDPLGKPDTYYPVADYELLTPDTEDICDAIRVEKLRFANKSGKGDPEPHIYSVAVQFAFYNESHPIRLSYDVSFIVAYPCRAGPHVLFYDYAYRAVKVDDLIGIRDWGPHSRNRRSETGKERGSSGNDTSDDVSNEVEEVLVIEAFGHEDNEVFARACCSHWGVSAVTACLRKTCMACAIREAYAACVTVVILTDGGKCQED